MQALVSHLLGEAALDLHVLLEVGEDDGELLLDLAEGGDDRQHAIALHGGLALKQKRTSAFVRAFGASHDQGGY